MNFFACTTRGAFATTFVGSSPTESTRCLLLQCTSLAACIPDSKKVVLIHCMLHTNVVRLNPRCEVTYECERVLSYESVVPRSSVLCEYNVVCDSVMCDV